MNRQQCEDRSDYLCIWQEEQYQLKDVSKELLSSVLTAFLVSLNKVFLLAFLSCVLLAMFATQLE